jgi:hypothetical protein
MSIAILHEGKKIDREFYNLFIDNLKLDKTLIKYYGFSSKNNFLNKNYKEYEDLLLEIKSERIDKILFIVDADYEKNDIKYGGFDNTLSKIIDIRKELNIYKISDMYITCDPVSNEGYLESLILSSIPDEQKNCIEEFLNCNDFKFKENHKAILNQIYKNAYPKAPYDFKHQNFDILKQKLQKLFKETN